jgi:hypothetical protein
MLQRLAQRRWVRDPRFKQTDPQQIHDLVAAAESHTFNEVEYPSQQIKVVAGIDGGLEE